MFRFFSRIDGKFGFKQIPDFGSQHIGQYEYYDTNLPYSYSLPRQD